MKKKSVKKTQKNSSRASKPAKSNFGAVKKKKLTKTSEFDWLAVSGASTVKQKAT
jgi:hypothetical protein